MHNIIILLFPFAPFIMSEVYVLSAKVYQENRISLGVIKQEFLHDCSWPSYNNKYLEEDTMSITIQINGKKRDVYSLPTSEDINLYLDKIKALPNIERFLENKKIKKTICIPGKIVNFVVV